MTTFTADDAKALISLKADIEAMANMTPQFSVTAYTATRTPHVVFANGAVKPEGCPIPELPAATIADLARATLRAVREYREQIAGPVLLTWRREPTVEVTEGKAVVSLRLAFEPDQWA